MTICRGIRARNARAARRYARQISWTLRRGVALWFAHRRAEPADMFIADTVVAPENILAYFDSRNEAELLVDPRDIKSVRVRRFSTDDLAAAQREEAEKLERQRERLRQRSAPPPTK